MKLGIIYKLTFIPTNKSYIGQTTQHSTRFLYHLVGMFTDKKHPIYNDNMLCYNEYMNNYKINSNDIVEYLLSLCDPKTRKNKIIPKNNIFEICNNRLIVKESTAFSDIVEYISSNILFEILEYNLLSDYYVYVTKYNTLKPQNINKFKPLNNITPKDCYEFYKLALDILEIHYINKLDTINNGYNKKDGGQTSLFQNIDETTTNKLCRNISKQINSDIKYIESLLDFEPPKRPEVHINHKGTYNELLLAFMTYNENTDKVKRLILNKYFTCDNSLLLEKVIYGYRFPTESEYIKFPTKNLKH